MVFKGNIETITEEEITYPPTRQSAEFPLSFPLTACYAIEHDTMDTTFRNMYYGLSAFASATKDRRDLLLAQRFPCLRRIVHLPASLPPPMISPVLPLKHKRPKIIFC